MGNTDISSLSDRISKLKVCTTQRNKNNASNAIDFFSGAMSNVKKFTDEVFVIKIGGSILDDKKLLDSMMSDIVILKTFGINPIVVHGGTRIVSDMFTKLNIDSPFIGNVRITNKKTVQVAEMVLSGMVNKNIVTSIAKAGGTAVGISGKDAGLIGATKYQKIKREPNSNVEKIMNLGYSGDPTYINPEILGIISDADMIPVVSPVGVGEADESYIIDADIVACVVAVTLCADRLIIVSDFDGVELKDGTKIGSPNVSELEKHIERDMISDDIKTKIEACINATANSVRSASMIKASTSHPIATEIMTGKPTGIEIIYDL